MSLSLLDSATCIPRCVPGFLPHCPNCRPANRCRAAPGSAARADRYRCSCAGSVAEPAGEFVPRCRRVRAGRPAADRGSSVRSRSAGTFAAATVAATLLRGRNLRCVETLGGAGQKGGEISMCHNKPDYSSSSDSAGRANCKVLSRNIFGRFLAFRSRVGASLRLLAESVNAALYPTPQKQVFFCLHAAECNG